MQQHLTSLIPEENLDTVIGDCAQQDRASDTRSNTLLAARQIRKECACAGRLRTAGYLDVDCDSCREFSLQFLLLLERTHLA